MELTVKSVTPFAEQRSRHFCLQLMHDVRRLGNARGLWSSAIVADWILVNGARIERSYFEANVQEACSVEWNIQTTSRSEGHAHCIICGIAIPEGAARMVSPNGDLCMYCFDEFVRAKGRSR